MSKEQLNKKPNQMTRKILRQIHILKRTKSYKGLRSAFVISDSKGYDLKRVKEIKYVRFFCKPGAEVTDTDIRSYTTYQARNRKNKYPVFILWFGTCSLTEKRNNLFVLKNNINEVVANTISDYRQLKEELLDLNPRAKIVFLDCPYYSLATFNKNKKKIFKDNFFNEQQKQLIEAIDLHNSKLRDLNKSVRKIPNLNKDFSYKSHKKGRKPKLQIDFKQLRDGCHIGPNLAKLWLFRIHRLIYRI